MRLSQSQAGLSLYPTIVTPPPVPPPVVASPFVPVEFANPIRPLRYPIIEYQRDLSRYAPPPPSGATRIHPGHRYWYNNPIWNPNGGGAQRTPFINSLSTIGNVNNFFNGVQIIMTWADMSDATLTNGAQTFNTFRGYLNDIYTQLRSVTTKKLYLTLKLWTGQFSSNPITTVNTQYFPQWMASKSPSWVKFFQQPSGPFRAQLDFDNPSVWSTMQELASGVANVINQVDTDRRLDIIGMQNDESVVADVSVNPTTTILNADNYNSMYLQYHLNIKPFFLGRVLWLNLNYMAGTNANTSMQSIMQQMQAAYPNGGIGYGGPDPPVYGVHGKGSDGTTNHWWSTFQEIATGNSGTLGDIRDTLLRISNCEGAGMGTGSGFAGCPPPEGSGQAFFDDTMTRKANLPTVPFNSIGPHSGFGSQVMHWNQSTACLSTSAILSLVNANSGFTTPLPPGNWDTSP